MIALTGNFGAFWNSDVDRRYFFTSAVFRGQELN